ncbi:MAG: hypothetical protein LUH50_15100 [Bacteroides intestinalis]|nr:hypothetical protein [Bacteroides intestinalis]
METLGYILLGVIGIVVIVYMFYLCRAVIAIIAFLLATYLFFFEDSLLAAGIVIGVWFILNSVTDKVIRTFAGMQRKTRLKKKKNNGSFSSRNSATKKRPSSNKLELYTNVDDSALLAISYILDFFQRQTGR